jgi:O-antigen ligase
MNSQFMDTWTQILYVIGTIIRPLCAMILGSVAGWLTAATFLDEDKEWQLKIALFLGLLGAFVTLNIYSGAGTTALFALGAGVAAIVYGVREMRAQAKPTKK